MLGHSHLHINKLQQHTGINVEEMCLRFAAIGQHGSAVTQIDFCVMLLSLLILSFSST